MVAAREAARKEGVSLGHYIKGALIERLFAETGARFENCKKGARTDLAASPEKRAQLARRAREFMQPRSVEARRRRTACGKAP